MTATTPDRANAAAKPSKALHIGLWVVQVLLALMFTFAGTMKATQPIAALAAQMKWPGAVPEALVRFIGVSELLGGLGLILPAATRIKPILTPVAAIGLVTVMAMAAAFHVSRGELSALPVNAVIGGLAAFVAWGRMKKAPIAPR
jgi:uncharacterized membrane protein YphA (DoxX/SURF4 family)